MDHYDAEVSSLEHSGHWLRQLRACLEMMKEEVRLHPEEAGRLFRPALALAEELAVTESTLETLVEQIQNPVEEPLLFGQTPNTGA